MAGTNGFTLADMVSYNEKHNEANGERGKDGPEENDSWNCGAEGPTRKRKVLELRKKQMKNAVLMLFFSQGTPMLLAGDEFGNSQSGNNNPYCQDNEITWLNWNQQKSNAEFYRFVKASIAFPQGASGFSSGQTASWYGQFRLRPAGHLLSWDESMAARIFLIPVISFPSCIAESTDTRKTEPGTRIFLLIYNMHWEPHSFALPKLPKGRRWHLVVDTGRKESENFRENGNEPMLEEQMTYEAEPRSIVDLMGKMHPELEEEPKARRTRREKHKNRVSTTKGQTP